MGPDPDVRAAAAATIAAAAADTIAAAAAAAVAVGRLGCGRVPHQPHRAELPSARWRVKASGGRPSTCEKVPRRLGEGSARAPPVEWRRDLANRLEQRRRERLLPVVQVAHHILEPR